MERKDFFKKGLAKFLGETLKEANQFVELVTKIPENIMKEDGLEELKNISYPVSSTPGSITKGLKFPPGAIPNKVEFKNQCSGCGECIDACPYQVLFSIFEKRYKKNIPYMDVNANACKMCKDWPCIKSCKDSALLPFTKKRKPKFGMAKLDFSYCINSRHEEVACSNCKDTCPIKGAVDFLGYRPVLTDKCVGCGLCVEACPPYPKAIVVK
ncbi:MAG: 4Fe-4S dicluster domain-containing protein [Leptospiraceae bacterium]|nr:4Fe-4S dicluster domain-containing protein [Leptospiraceae bacterium]MCP5495692.1 4Fe-4S dicluster domain-containing protein [Leptospiraceae bacterium]